MFKNLLIILSLFIYSNAYAADPCAMAKNQIERDQCSERYLQNADGKLNQIYKAIVVDLNHEQRQSLVNAQRAWINYRDANCDSQVFDHKNKDAYINIYNICLAVVTKARITELKRIYHINGQDNISTDLNITEGELLGAWQSIENGYATEITFGIKDGVHYYLSHLNNLPFETGQWELNNGQLSIKSNNGKVIHFYDRINLNANTLFLYQHDGDVEKYQKIQKNVKP
jgi:uncharacterized protein YecT (DUF1311 family)